MNDIVSRNFILIILNELHKEENSLVFITIFFQVFMHLCRHDSCSTLCWNYIMSKIQL